MSVRTLKAMVPWRAKLAAKLVLSQIPVGYQFWKRLQLFEHGRMDEPSYAFHVCKQHFAQYTPQSSSRFDVLELGPGDSLASALIAKAFGASSIHLVDTQRYASEAIDVYRATHRYLLEGGFDCPGIDTLGSVEAVLAACNAHYLTDGLRSLRALPSHSIDFIWSHAVLEHVRLKEFGLVQAELRRILRPGGVCSHQIDLRDHLNMKLNHLRYSRKAWESTLFADAGFYTNRLRLPQLLTAFDRAGFCWRIVSRITWDKLPIRREALAEEFRQFEEADLCVSGIHVVLS